jgi:prepilin-type N-terminal cleavage/methylation domain-containing protein
MKSMKSKSGFTLIELLIVISIIAILVSIGASAFSKGGRGSSRGDGYDRVEDNRRAPEGSYSN